MSDREDERREAQMVWNLPTQLEVAERLLLRAQGQLYCRGRGPETLVECAVGDLITRYFELKHAGAQLIADSLGALPLIPNNSPRED